MIEFWIWLLGVLTVVQPERIAFAATARCLASCLLCLIPADALYAADRTDEIAERLNYFISWSSNIAGWVGVGMAIGAVTLAILTIIVTVLGIVIGFFGYSGYVGLRRTQAKADQNAKQLEDDARALRNQIQALEELIRENYNKLAERIESKVEFYRFYLLGQLSYDNSDFNQAYWYFEKAKQVEDSKEINLKRARCLTYRNAVSEATSILEKLRQENPDDAEVIRALALCKRFSQPGESILLFEEALKKVGGDVQMRATIENELGLVHRDQGNYSSALQFHTRSYGDYPNNSITLYFIGVADALLNKKEDAVSFLRLAASNAEFQAETQQIKGIWERIIKWSWHVVQNEYDQAKTIWSEIASTIQPEYLRLTVLAHVDCICEAFDVNKDDVIT